MQKILDYAAISKLCLSEEESSAVEAAVRLFEESFKSLDSIACENAEPLVTVLDMKNVLREDVSYKMLPREELLANAPEQYDSYFQVPKTIE